jgi:hypothetical protein
MRSDFDTSKCSYPRCKHDSHIVIYILGHPAGLCVEHWLQHCGATKALDMNDWKKDGPNGRVEERIARRR